MAESLVLDGIFKDLISSGIERVQGRLKALGFTSDGVFKGLLKFASAEKVFQSLSQVAGVVWKEALAQSPKIQEQFTQIKEKLGVLVATLAKEFVPVIQNVFKFILDNWQQIRFAFSVGIAVVQDTFRGLLGAFQTLASGFFNGLGLISTALSKFGLVSKETAEGFNQTSEQFAEAAITNFGKVGKTVDVVKAGMNSLGKEVKATYDIFGDKKKLEDAAKALEANNEAASDKAEAIGKKSRQIMRTQREEELAMIAEENQAKIEIRSRLADENIAFMELQGGKELEVLAAQQAKEREEITKTKGFKLLNETEKATAIGTLDKKYSLERTKTEKKLQEDKIAAAQVGFSGYSSLLTQAASNYKSFAKAAQYVSQVEAGINTALAITNALATVKPTFPLGVFVAGGIAAQGLAQQNKIASQHFEKGGIVEGGEQTITVNERGIESVLNARATRNLGRNTINALNSGQGLGSTVVTVAAPVLNFYGRTEPEEVRAAVAQSQDDQVRDLQRIIDHGMRNGSLRFA